MPLISNRDVHHTKVARLDGRTFYVRYGANGKPLRISERKKYGRSPIDGWYNAVYWNAKHHPIGKGDTMVKKILAAADALSP